jgi:histidyl-tRNA synthetase
MYIVLLDKSLQNFAYQTAIELRRNNIKVDLDYLSRSVKAQMRDANKLNAKFVLFIGGDEFTKGEVVLKKMSDGTQLNLSKENLNKIISTISAK